LIAQWVQPSRWGIPAEQGVQSKKTRFSFAPDKAVWINSFPSGLSSAPCELTFPAGAPRELDFVAGYFAVEQNVEDLALSPVIGWSIKDRAPATPVMVTRFPVEAEPD
jgi:hypothetical protein